MKALASTVLVAAVILFSGCTAIDIDQDVYGGHRPWEEDLKIAFANTVAPAVDRKVIFSDFNSNSNAIGRLLVQLTGEQVAPFSAVDTQKYEKPLPDEIAKNQYARKLIADILDSHFTSLAISDKSLTVHDVKVLEELRQQVKQIAPKRVNRFDMDNLGELLITMNADASANGLEEKLKKVEEWRKEFNGGNYIYSHVAYTYFAEYYAGDFVDRAGNKISKPSVDGKSISNELLAAHLAVFAESVADWLQLEMHSGGYPIKAPVLYKDKDGKLAYLNAGKAKPSFISLIEPTKAMLAGDENFHATIVDAKVKDGISEQELKYITKATGKLTSKAEALAGGAIQTFDGISIGLGVLGEIAIGDNELLSKLVQTGAGKLVDRATNAALLHLAHETDF